MLCKKKYYCKILGNMAPKQFSFCPCHFIACSCFQQQLVSVLQRTVTFKKSTLSYDQFPPMFSYLVSISFVLVAQQSPQFQFSGSEINLHSFFSGVGAAILLTREENFELFYFSQSAAVGISQKLWK